MTKKGLYKVNKNDYMRILDAYKTWKKFDEMMREYSSRGVNFHEGISETIVCYVNDFYHSVGKGSEDAVTNNEELVQVKASSNFNEDLTSFGPTSKFDFLHFARLDKEEDKLYLYDIPIKELYEVPVNKNETFKDKQLKGQRPRFSIIKKYLSEDKEKPYAIVDLNTGNINKNK